MPRVSLGILSATPTEHGLVLRSIDPSSSLGQAGLVSTDELISIGGTRASDAEACLAILERVGVGNVVEVQYVRAGRVTSAAVPVLAALGVELQTEDVDDVVGNAWQESLDRMAQFAHDYKR